MRHDDVQQNAGLIAVPPPPSARAAAGAGAGLLFRKNVRKVMALNALTGAGGGIGGGRRFQQQAAARGNALELQRVKSARHMAAAAAAAVNAKANVLDLQRVQSAHQLKELKAVQSFVQRQKGRRTGVKAETAHVLAARHAAATLITAYEGAAGAPGQKRKKRRKRRHGRNRAKGPRRTRAKGSREAAGNPLPRTPTQQRPLETLGAIAESGAEGGGGGTGAGAAAPPRQPALSRHRSWTIRGLGAQDEASLAAREMRAAAAGGQPTSALDDDDGAPRRPKLSRTRSCTMRTGAGGDAAAAAARDLQRSLGLARHSSWTAGTTRAGRTADDNVGGGGDRSPAAAAAGGRAARKRRGSIAEAQAQHKAIMLGRRRSVTFRLGDASEASAAAAAAAADASSAARPHHDDEDARTEDAERARASSGGVTVPPPVGTRKRKTDGTTTAAFGNYTGANQAAMRMKTNHDAIERRPKWGGVHKKKISL